MGDRAPIDDSVGGSDVARREMIRATIVYGVVLLLILGATSRTPVNGGRGHDGGYYAGMAADETTPQRFVAARPFCYRPLTPLLVSLLPGPVVNRFVVFNFAAWWAALVGWHALGRCFGLKAKSALFGGLLLATSAWGPMSAFYKPCYVEPLMYVFVIGGLLLMLHESKWLALWLPAAMLQRPEQCAIVLVAAAARHFQKQGWSRRAAMGYGLIAALCAAVYVTVRLVVPAPQSFGKDLSPLEVCFQTARWLWDEPHYVSISLMAIAYALSVPLVGIAVFGEARSQLMRERWIFYYLFLCLFSLLGGSDKARLAFLAAPVVLLLFVGAIQRAAPRHLCPMLLILLLLHLYVQFPPSLMIAGHGLMAPLIDDPDRGTHAASWVMGAIWPVPLRRVAAHLAISLGLSALALMLIRINGVRSPGGPDLPIAIGQADNRPESE